MRCILLALCITVINGITYGQRNGSNSSYPQKIPDKDPVMVIEHLNAGASKTYFWNSSTAQIAINGFGNNTNKTVSVYSNSLRKRLLSVKLTEEPRLFQVKLTQRKNAILLQYNNKTGSKLQDSVSATIFLTDGELKYMISAALKDDITDTIILKH